jgi:hypothetical protein
MPSSSLGTIGSALPASSNIGGGPLGLGEGATGMKTLQQNLDKVFGNGVGNAITQFLGSGAGYSPQILQQLFAQLQPGFAQQQQNLIGQFSAGGNRFGSGAQIGYADLLGQQSMTEGSVAANLYEQAVTNYMNVLMGTSTAAANEKSHQPSTWDTIAGIMGLAGSGAQAASSITSAINPSADTGILDALGGL